MGARDALVLHAKKCVGTPSRPSAASAADTVHIVLNGERKAATACEISSYAALPESPVVYDALNARNVQPARRHVCRNEQGKAARFECGNRLGALLLRHVALDLPCVPAPTTQPLANPGGLHRGEL